MRGTILAVHSHNDPRTYTMKHPLPPPQQEALKERSLWTERQEDKQRLTATMTQVAKSQSPYSAQHTRERRKTMFEHMLSVSLAPSTTNKYSRPSAERLTTHSATV